VLALWLTRLGVKVRLIDKVSEPGTRSRALAVQARTLEFYQQVGLAEAVVDRGHKVPALNLWVKGAKAATVPLQKMGQGSSHFPFPIIFPQDEP
jgi:2-polyprenyl-6-methoxyphenol hydroxylase-like FAD-dependent oxidoreductase